MLNRTSLLTFAAVATLALSALAPISASAKGGNHGGNHGGGMHVSHGMKGSHGQHFNRHHFRHRQVRWHRNYHYRYVKPIFPVYNTYSVARPAVPTCNCLTKTYLENGAVLFQDVCTKESATNQPADDQAQAQ